MADRRRLRGIAAARAALARRRDVRASLTVARGSGTALRIVGGAVRDAFLGRRGGDLDLAVPGADAAPFAAALAARLGTRAIPMGRPGTRVFRVPAPPGEIDVWEISGSFDEDRDRRDFTVNALAFAVPGWRLDAPAGALADLAAGRLRLPRAGVLLEDPLRVLRAARFRAELEGFAVCRTGLSELREAARLLPGIAAERRLSEWDRILAAEPARAARALLDLERWGALGVLLPGTTAAGRRAGIRRVSRLPRGVSPAAARAALLAPLGDRAAAILESWKVPKDELRMAAALRTLPSSRRGGAPARPELARFVRALAPWVAEAGALLLSSGSRPLRTLGEALTRLRPAAVARLVKPRRFLASAEVARRLGIGPGPALGRALAALDEAVAEGRVTTSSSASRFLAGMSR